MKIKFYPQGVCCQQMEVEIKDGKIVNAQFFGGCNGNLKGIASLIRGMKVEDVIERIQGTTCGGKATSCPDQLSLCLKEYLTSVAQKQKI